MDDTPAMSDASEPPIECKPQPVPGPGPLPGVEINPTARAFADPARFRRSLLRAAGFAGLAALSAGLVNGCVASPSADARARSADVDPRASRAGVRRIPAPDATPRPMGPPPARTQPVRPLRLHAIPRTAWTRSAVGSNTNPLGEVTRVTVHHAGGNAFWATDASSTYRLLESIRQGHRRNGWADLGYHFIVDRAGRVIEGRSLRFQGAHVSRQNENNVGVMVLGNFNDQSPSAAQLQGLNTTLNALCAAYAVPVHRVYTHQEFSNTACPGRRLQAHMNQIRHAASLARG